MPTSIHPGATPPMELGRCPGALLASQQENIEIGAAQTRARIPPGASSLPFIPVVAQSPLHSPWPVHAVGIKHMACQGPMTLLQHGP